jgi:hypothetical protein
MNAVDSGGVQLYRFQPPGSTFLMRLSALALTGTGRMPIFRSVPSSQVYQGCISPGRQ